MAPSQLGWEEIRVAIALTVVTTIVVVLRFVARLVKKLSLQLDDWLAIASLVFIYGMFIELILWATIGNTGKHIRTLELPQITQFFKIFLSQEYTYGIASPLVKLTLLAFYRRLFSNVRPFRITVDVVAAFCVIWGIITIVTDSVQCIPLSAYWTLDPTAKCIDSVKFVQGIQGINVVLDLVILIMPMPMVWGLKRPWQDRLALSAVFLLGTFVLAASIYRFVALFQLDADDITYSIHSALVWTYVEPCIGLVCACLPIIRGLFPTYTKKTTTGYYGNASGYGKRSQFSSHNMPAISHNDEYYKMADSQGGTSLEDLTPPGHGIHVTRSVNVS